MGLYYDKMQALGFNIILPLDDAQNLCAGDNDGTVNNLGDIVLENSVHKNVYGEQLSMLKTESTDSMQYLDAGVAGVTDPCLGGPIAVTSYTDTTLPDSALDTHAQSFTVSAVVDISDNAFINNDEHEYEVFDLYDPDLMDQDSILKQYTSLNIQVRNTAFADSLTIWVRMRDPTKGDYTLLLASHSLTDVMAGRVQPVHHIVITFTYTNSGTPREGTLIGYLNGVEAARTLAYLNLSMDKFTLGDAGPRILGVNANFTFVPTTGSYPLIVTFDASSTLGKDIVSYAWNFGLGNTATGITTTYTFDEAGTFPVTLTVTNSDGRPSVYTADVIVTEPAPIALACPLTGPVTTDLLVDGSGNQLNEDCS